jgi:hypothetical protein
VGLVEDGLDDDGLCEDGAVEDGLIDVTVGCDDDGCPEGCEVDGRNEYVGVVELGELVGDDDVGWKVVKVGELDEGVDVGTGGSCWLIVQ